MQNPTLAKATRRLFLASLALVMACPVLYGQDSTPAVKPSAAPVNTPPAQPTDTVLGTARAPASPPSVNITPEQQEKLRAAYQTALKAPEVISARSVAEGAVNSYHGIARKKAVADDPSMQPIFDKADKAVASNAPGGVLGALTPEERTKLHDVFQKVSLDPAVKQAMEKSAEAVKAVNAAVRAAILKGDPSLKSVLDEIDEAAKRAPHQGPGNPPVP